MAARRDDSAPDPEPGPTLRHNPFAVLKKDGVGASSSLENARPTSAGAPEPSAEQRSDRSRGSRRSSRDARGAPAASPASIVVRREKKGHGGKAVTLAEGAGLAGRDLEALARELAKALGAGARVEEGRLVVQGEQTDRLIAQLEQRGFHGIVRGN